MAQLTDRASIALSGADARPWLQGLTTNDVTKLAPDRPLYAALLTPQGKILFDFLLNEDGGAILIDCPAPAREALVKRLSLYKLRAKVVIEPRDDLGVYVDEGGPADPRLEALGARAVSLKRPSPAGDDAFRARRLDLGVPEAGDFGSDRMFALDAGLDELHAVAFDKGCYVGQELTARMKHRGSDRKRLLPVATTGGNPLPGPDVPVKAGGQEVGTITSVYGARGFALIRLDRLETAGGDALEAAGAPVQLKRPAWLFT